MNNAISSVQLLNHVQLFATPWIAGRQASLSITNSQSSLKLMSIKSVMPSSHHILCCPLLLLPQIPPRIRVFSNESTLHMKWPKYWSFSFSISPSKEHPGLISFRMDWLDLLAVQGTLKSLLQHHSSKAPILWCSAFFTVQLPHPYMTTGKTVALTRWTFVGKLMSLPFNMLSRLPEKSHGQKSLVGCSPWGHTESDMTERLHSHFLLSCIGEGNDNPLQFSCLENPRDGGACWAAVYGVTQSRTRLKRLSSRLVITFLPRSKSLLISWLQSLSAVILECSINEIKNTLEGTNSRIIEAEDRISEVEDRIVEINETEKKKEWKDTGILGLQRRIQSGARDEAWSLWAFV